MNKKTRSLLKCIKVFLVAMGIIWICQLVVFYIGIRNNGGTSKSQQYTNGGSQILIDGEQITSWGFGENPFDRIIDALIDVSPYGIMIVYICLLVVFGIWYSKCYKKTNIAGTSIKDIVTFKNSIGFLFIAVGACYFLNFVTYMLIPDVLERPIGHCITIFEMGYEYENIWILIAIMLLAPIAEELIFRGVMLHYAYDLNSTENNNGAIVIQAIFFGIMYFWGLHCFSGFLIGLILGYLTYRFRSILPAMIVHLILNALSTLTVYPIMYALFKNNTYFVIIALAFLGLFAVGLYLIREEKKLSVEEDLESLPNQ